MLSLVAVSIGMSVHCVPFICTLSIIQQLNQILVKDRMKVVVLAKTCLVSYIPQEENKTVGYI